MDNIEKYRNIKKNEILSFIKEKEDVIKNNIERIKTLKKSSMNTTFVVNSVNKLTDENNRLTEDINTNKSLYSEVGKGILDDKLINERVNNRTKQEKHQVDSKNIKDIKKQGEKDVVDRIKIQNKKKDTTYASKYILEKYYSIYQKNISTIPDFIKKKLKEMTEDSGYIWREIWLNGEKKCKDEFFYQNDKHIYTFYEPVHKGKTIIHRYNKYHHVKYLNTINSQPIETITRKQRSNNNSLEQFIKK